MLQDQCEFSKVSLTAAAWLPLLFFSAVRADDWPQFRGQNRDAVWNETGIAETFPAKGLNVRWRVPVGVGFSSPVVANGRLYFIDALFQPKLQERVRCLDERTGQLLWSHSYPVTYPDWATKPESPNGPVATPLVRDGRAYTLGRSGNLICFSADKGTIHWQKNVVTQYDMKEFFATSSPLIEGNLLILQLGGKPDASVVAFNAITGDQVWKALNEDHYHSSPIAIDAGGKRQLIVWTQASVSSLDPTTGNLYWREKFLGGTPVSTPAFDKSRNLLLVAGLMLRLDPDKPTARVLWPKTSAAGRRILSGTSTGVILGDHVYSAKSSGEFVCLDSQSGEEVWLTEKVTGLKNGASIHITVNGGSVLMFTDEGNLIRARLTPKSYTELSRVRLVEPTYMWSGKKLIWPPPAYANRHVFARNDIELISASLADPP